MVSVLEFVVACYVLYVFVVRTSQLESCVCHTIRFAAGLRRWPTAKRRRSIDSCPVVLIGILVNAFDLCHEFLGATFE